MIQDSNKQNALTHLNLAWCTIQEITNNSAGKRCTRMREVDEGVAHPGMFQVKKTHHAGEHNNAGLNQPKMYKLSCYLTLCSTHALNLHVPPCHTMQWCAQRTQSMDGHLCFPHTLHNE